MMFDMYPTAEHPIIALKECLPNLKHGVTALTGRSYVTNVPTIGKNLPMYYLCVMGRCTPDISVALLSPIMVLFGANSWE